MGKEEKKRNGERKEMGTGKKKWGQSPFSPKNGDCPHFFFPVPISFLFFLAILDGDGIQAHHRS
jgi:hypothetical protein